MLESFLFALYFGFFTWLTYKPNRKTKGEVIKIVTATPKEQAQNQPIVAVEVNLDSSIKHQQSRQPFVLPAKPVFEANGTGKVGLTTLAQMAIALRDNIATKETAIADQTYSGGGITATNAYQQLVRELEEENGDARAVESDQNTAPQLMYDKKIINEAVSESRLAVVKKIKEFVETKNNIEGAYQALYELLTDYPFRVGKMLRPTMCISVARAVGGMGQDALTSASALELYHNAFLIHDDIEDGSESRRGKGTLHQMIGIPRAINVGDATNVLAVGLLLENLSVIGVAKALNVLHEIEFMAQQSVEGQAMELDWIASNASNLTDQDYFRMCVKKTCWYTFITPCRIGLIVGHPSASSKELVKDLAGVTRFGMMLGIAFQIQDDLLNLQGEIETYGKEIGGDIYEGKRTLMLNHVLAHSGKSAEILKILALPREKKTPEQLAFIMEQMQQCGSIEHGWKVARSLAQKAAEIFDSLDFLHSSTPLRSEEQWGCSVHDRRFLKELINYVIYRNA